MVNMKTKTALGQMLKEQGRRYTWVGSRLTPPVLGSTVSRWASGDWDIPEFRIPQLAELLGVDEEDIRG